MHPAEEALDIRQDLLGIRPWLESLTNRRTWIEENLKYGVPAAQTLREIGNQQICHQILGEAAPVWASRAVVERLRPAINTYPLTTTFSRGQLWRLNGFLWSETPLFTVRRLERVQAPYGEVNVKMTVDDPVHGLVWGLYRHLPHTFDSQLTSVELGVRGSHPHVLALHAICRDRVTFPALHFYIDEGLTLEKSLAEERHPAFSYPQGEESYPAEAEQLVRWWIVFQHFLRERVLLTTPQTPSRHQRKRYERAGVALGDVQVISLRKVAVERPPTEPVPGETPEERAKREYTCRWWVDPHWRQQWYPAAQEHRAVWIDTYDKGPEHLDFREPRRKVHAAVR